MYNIRQYCNIRQYLQYSSIFIFTIFASLTRYVRLNYLALALALSLSLSLTPN